MPGFSTLRRELTPTASAVMASTTMMLITMCGGMAWAGSSVKPRAWAIDATVPPSRRFTVVTIQNSWCMV